MMSKIAYNIYGLSMKTVLSCLIVIALVATFLVSCRSAVESQPEVLPGDSCQVIDRKVGNMPDEVIEADVERLAVPPIDTSAPARMETATFALG
jgi:hypothetical protein